MNSSPLPLLGLARRAGKLEIGFDVVKECMLEGKAYLVVCAEDISPKTFKEINFFAAKSPNHDLAIIKLNFDRDALSKAIGKSAACVAVKDDGFAKKIQQLHNSGGNL